MRSGAPGVWLAMLVAACVPSGSKGSELGPVVEADLPVVDFFGEVSSVADGDSFRVVVEGEEMEVRLLGINAPERDECYGSEATAWLTETIEGKEVGLAVQPEPDQFGRLLAAVVADKTDVNESSLATGHSLAISVDGEHRSRHLAAEEVARKADLGMWGEEICGASGPIDLVQIEDVDHDPPGPDEVESVTIANKGVDTVDLTGFVLRDESSVNRFELPQLKLAGEENVTFFVRRCLTAQSVMDLCSEDPVFNNDGDTALLLDPFGRIVALARY